MHRYISTLAHCLISTLLLSGCVMRSLDDAPSESRISFAYTADVDGGGSSNVIADYIDDVTLFVFDLNSGRYVTSLTVGKEQLLSPQGFPLDLPDGNYRIVCWGNAGENTTLATGTTFDESLLSQPGFIDENVPLTTADHLYYGSGELRLPQAEGDNGCYITFNCAHIHLEVYIKGLPADAAPQVEFRHLTPQYDFLMRPVHPYSADYQPVVRYEAGKKQYVARLQTLRFDTDNPITLEIRSSTGESLYTLALAEFMANNDLPEPQSKAGKETTRAITTENVQELTIPIVITFGSEDGKDVSISIGVPSWGTDPVKPGI